MNRINEYQNELTGQSAEGILKWASERFGSRIALATSFGEYLLPLATDVPRIAVAHMESPSPLNPLGVKGAGEGGTLPAIAAVVAAVEDALSPFGVTIDEAPISPMRIVELIRKAAPETYE